MSLREDIEDRAIDLLTQLKKQGKGGAAGGYLNAVELYSGDVRPQEDDDALKELLQGGMPCVGVMTGAGNYGDFRQRHLDGEIELVVDVLVVSGNLRSRAARNRGDVTGPPGDPGAYAIMEDVRRLLFTDDLGVDGAGGATPVVEEPVLRTPAMTIWHMAFAITGDVAQPAPDADDIDLETIHNSVNLAEDDSADPVLEGEHTLETP